MACNTCNTNTNCNEGNLGCLHTHNAECVVISATVNGLAAGTDLQTVLESFNIAEDGVSIINAEVVGGELILYFSNNTQINVGTIVGTNGTNCTNGTNGTNGVGIQSATVNGSGNLIITLTDSSTINAGNVVGTDGADGVDGNDGVGIDTITTNGNGDTIITLTDETVINLGNVSSRIHFGDSHDNPNTATSLDPLTDYLNEVVDNKTTIIPVINTCYFNIDTKEIWTYNGTSWSNPMSIGSHLIENSFGHNYNSVDEADKSTIYSYTPLVPLENGEQYIVRVGGSIYSNVGIQVEVSDGTADQNVGVAAREQEGDPYENRFSFELVISRKSATTYVSVINGIIQADTGAILTTPTGTFLPFTRTVVTGSMDTTVSPDINIFGVSTSRSPIQSDAIVIETFSVEKLKY